MATLLFVRSIADIHSALIAVNDFLACRKSYDCPLPDEEMLGVCIRTGLDTNLPGLLHANNSFRESTDSNQATHLIEPEIGIRESISLSGLWSLCWLDGPLFRQAGSASEQRKLILQALVNTSSAFGSSQQPVLFLPVFNKNESAEEIATEVRRLETTRPYVIAPVDYVRTQIPELHGRASRMPPG